QLQAGAKAREPCEAAIDHSDPTHVARPSAACSDRQPHPLAPKLRGIGAADGGAITREIDARNGAFALGIPHRQPLPTLLVEMESTSRKIGELSLRFEAEADPDGVA